METRKNIVIISPYPLFPPYGGNRARMLTLIRTLQAQARDVTFVLLTSRQMGDFDEGAHRAMFGDRFYPLYRSPISNALYLLQRFVRAQSRSVRSRFGRKVKRLDTIDELYYKPFTVQLQDLFAAKAPDAVVVQYAYFSRALEAFPSSTLKILDTHDSFEREIAADQEKKGLARANVVVAIQDGEAERFRRLLGPCGSRVAVVSHILAEQSPLSCARSIGATFFGSSFVANLASLRYFIDDVLPLVLGKAPEFKLVVAGSICHDIKDHPAIRKLGTVGTIRDAFVDAPILINPIRDGTGIKIKLLEAMSLGVPGLSTCFGVRGIDPTFLGGVITVPDQDSKGFAEKLVELYRDADQRAVLGARAFKDAVRWNERQLAALNQVLH
jgi:polysaccharide biosynthesis protein PslH